MQIPTTSKCAVLEEFKKPLVIKQLPIPDVEPGAILVKTLLATLCGSDIGGWMGQSRIIKLPRIFGHEMVGEVVKLGQGVTKDWFEDNLNVGDRIVFSPASCGRCYFCNVLHMPNFCPNRISYASGSSTCDKPPYLLGACSEYIYVAPTCGVKKLPPEVENEEASPATCAFRTVIRSFERLGEIGTEDTVLIQGAGNLGLCATVLADNSSARRVIVVDITDERLADAKRFGADVTLNASVLTEEELQKQVLELTDGRGADIVLNYSTVASTFKQGLELIRKGGRYIVIGNISGKIEFDPSIVLHKELNIKGTYSADISHYHKAIEFLKNNKDKYPFKELVTSRHKLEDVNEALYAMVEGRDRKPAIVFE